MTLDPFHRYFRAQANPDEALYELCYMSAYDALPTAVQRDGEKFWKDYYLARYPGLAWYTHLCLLTDRESDPYSAATFRWHKGRVSSGREYMILEYPEPWPCEEPEDPEERVLLAPYFSVVLRQTTSKPSSCFALGQTPQGDDTTLRRCRLAAHYNLGVGPEANLEELVEVLDDLESLPVLGHTVRHPKYLDDVDRGLIADAESAQ